MMQLPSPELVLKNKNDIENDFLISLHYNDLPIHTSPSRITSCLVCLCLAGKADIEVDLWSYEIIPNDIMVVFPGQILACNQKSGDFSLAYFSISNQLTDEILFLFPSAFIGFLRDSVKYQLPEPEKEKMFAEYFAILHSKFDEKANICRGEIIGNLLHNFYLDLYNNVVSSNRIHPHQRKRKKELLEEFFRLVKTHTENREVAFYADKLCITPKYLSIITKESSGLSAKALIDKFAVKELKLQLNSTYTPIKEIAEKLNFPCEAFLCKFFKKRTGMSPSHYRNANR